MASHSSPPGSKRQRQDSQSPESAPARKTPRSYSKATSTSTSISTSASASASDHGDVDTTMEDVDDFVLFESSAPAPPPQHHYTHPVTGTRPTQGELYGTAARAQSLTTAFNTGRESTRSLQTTHHSPSAPRAPDSPASTLVASAQPFGPCHGIFRPAGTRHNSPATSPTDDRGRRLSTDADSVGSSFRRSSHAEISPTHRHTGRSCRDNPSKSPSKPHRPALSLQKVQSLSVDRTSSTVANRMAAPTLDIATSPAPRPAAYASHRASFLGASTDPGEAASGNRGGAGFGLDRAPSHYRHPTAESEDESIPERPPTRRGRGSSQDLLSAQEAVRRQKEEDADDELAEQEGEDGDEDDEDGDEEDGMDLN